MKTTVTEALASLKTIVKRVDSKREALRKHCAHYSHLKDPLAASGGSAAFWKAETQAIRDLHDRSLTIRTAIQHANHLNEITLHGETRTVAAWLIWKREVAPNQLSFLREISNSVRMYRDEARRSTRGQTADQVTPDVITSFDELEFMGELKKWEAMLADLDGQLSLFNARTEINV